jgi:hypothetical protein
MASSAERFHIVLSPDERSAWNSGAARLGVATAEYVRRAVASFEAGLTPVELDQLSSLAGEVEQSTTRMSAMIDRAVAAVDRPFDDASVRLAAAERLAADPVWLDPARLDFRAPTMAS